jgi:spore coat polysaccharide biosynthesis predicted glycosyltransferase SpsG
MKGTMIWNSQMERVYLERGKSQKLSNRKREILITLGGSSKIVEEINQICAKIKELQLIELLNITVCVNESILEEITSTNTSGTAFNFQVFGENYYQKLISADLLLCASGTSATEAYHLGVPSIIFSLFENARKNFSTLQEFFTTAVFLDSSEDLTPRVIELYLSELEEGRRSSTPTRVGSINKTQVKTMLNFLLDL